MRYQRGSGSKTAFSRVHYTRRVTTIFVAGVLYDGIVGLLVLDNPMHITDSGAELRFQPPYSPDLNPIEFTLAKLKTLLR